ncbi:MAG: hypothetical protein DLM69_00575, partial [Candidatus Chloroheliales bacterium]
MAKKTNPAAVNPRELVLKVAEPTPEAIQLIARYDEFITALCEGRAYQEAAIRQMLYYLLGGSTRNPDGSYNFQSHYSDLSALADENWQANPRIQQRYPDRNDYHKSLQLATQDKKSKQWHSGKLYATLDLATGTGKSYLLYGLAQIMLDLGAVDNVLLVCPNLIIFDGLSDKFKRLNARSDLRRLLPHQTTPAIRDAQVEFAPYDICITNIHKTYKDVKSAIETSLKQSGQRTLVLNDEVHHIAGTLWQHFLLDYPFRYVVGVTGTAYRGSSKEKADEYFTDVIYRYDLLTAIREGHIKAVRYVSKAPKKNEAAARWAGIIDNHERVKADLDKLGLLIRPVTIIVTYHIDKCRAVANELIEHLARPVGADRAAIEKSVLVVNSAPENDQDVRDLQEVDEYASARRVEWIVSVSMLTEGWDAKNVFQIVPDEERAFSSKLLIAQVVGRGLRLPAGLETRDATLTVFNHPRYSEVMRSIGATDTITAEAPPANDALATNLAAAVEAATDEPVANLLAAIDEKAVELGIDRKEVVSHPVMTPPRAAYHFDLHNLKYQVAEDSETVVGAEGKAELPKLNFSTYVPIKPSEFDYARYEGPAVKEDRQLVRSEADDVTHTIADTVQGMLAALRADPPPKPEVLAHYDEAHLITMLVAALKEVGNPGGPVSDAHYNDCLRQIDELRPRPTYQRIRRRRVATDWELVSTTSDNLVQKRGLDYFHTTATLFYDPHSLSLTEPDYRTDLQTLLDQKAAGENVHCERMFPTDFLSPVNVVISGSKPERDLLYSLAVPALNELPACVQAWIKSADTRFYTIPYDRPAGYKGSDDAGFNPDLFIKLDLNGQPVMLVIEIKDDEKAVDRENKAINVAKLDAAQDHFETINKRLKVEAGNGEHSLQYIFLFLSPASYKDFFTVLHRCDL